MAATSGLITGVGLEVALTEPTEFCAVAATTRYFPTSLAVGVKVADVAPEISVHVLASCGSVQDFH